MQLRFVLPILPGALAIALVQTLAIPRFEITAAVLVPLTILVIYLAACLSGKNSSDHIRDAFRNKKLAGDTIGDAISIGGVYWTISNGQFFRAARWGGQLDRPIPDRDTSQERRLERHGMHHISRIALIAIATVIPPIMIWANYAPAGAQADEVIASIRFMLDASIAICVLVSVWEIVYRRGNQNILGAMVLDPLVQQPNLKAVEDQKAHGDARLATEEEARTAAAGKAMRRSKVNRLEFIGSALTDSPDVEKRLLEDDGTDRPSDNDSTSQIYLGRYYDPKNDEPCSELLYRGDRHLLVFGPTGSGKGRRFLIPNLLSGLRDQSVIIIDPKGEAAALTADVRRKMGHEVIILNPFNVGGLGSAGFNPLAVLDPTSPLFYDDAAAIGEALIKIEEKDPHWSQSAQGLIVALLMWEKLRNGDDANLENVRTMLTEANEWRSEAVEGEKPRRIQTAGLRATAVKMVESGGDEIASLGARFTGDTVELENIKSTADTQTRWILSRSMKEDLRKDGIDFASLKERCTTVYLILPAERLRTHSVWLRLVIVSALRSLYHPGGRKVLMLIDEMAALGHLAPLEDAFGLVRGYGIQIAAVLQDLGQLKELYKERWETFIANAGVVFGFAPNDLTTAEWMSKRSGQTTVVAKGATQNTGTSTGEKSSSSEGAGMSDQQIGRPFFQPHQLFGFDQGMGVLWLAGLDHTVRFFAPDYQMIREGEQKL